MISVEKNLSNCKNELKTFKNIKMGINKAKKRDLLKLSMPRFGIASDWSENQRKKITQSLEKNVLAPSSGRAHSKLEGGVATQV